MGSSEKSFSPEDYLTGDVRMTAEGSKFSSYAFELVKIWKLVDPFRKYDADIKPMILLVAKRAREAVLFRGNFLTIKEPLEKFLAIAERTAREAEITDEFLPLKDQITEKFSNFKLFLDSMSVKHSLFVAHTEKWINLFAKTELVDGLGGYDLRFLRTNLGLSEAQVDELKNILFLRDRYLKTDDYLTLQKYLRNLRDFSKGSFVAEMVKLEDDLTMDILWIEITSG